MSHLDRDRLREKVAAIREVEARYKRPIAILADLQGPKLRVGTFGADSATLKQGSRFVLDSDEAPGDAKRVHLPHPEILDSLEEGHSVLMDDGKLRLEVEEVKGGRAVTRVAVGGKISNRKGVNLPDTEIPVAAMTKKDRTDLEAALDAGVDWIGMSFVQRPEDVAEGRKVARGDLGVEMPLEKVPGLQKRITRACRRMGKPVVVATQMLESMISSPVPTRAEVSDVATAVYEGADAIMLSAESASGQYPVEAVATMNRIAEEVENDPTYRSIVQAQRAEPEKTGADAIAAAARQIADTLDLCAIISWTFSGSTALRVARERPSTPVVAISPNISTGRRLSLVWGVHCVVAQDARDQDDMVNRACRIAVQDGFADPGKRVIIVAGVPLGTPGAT